MLSIFGIDRDELVSSWDTKRLGVFFYESTYTYLLFKKKSKYFFVFAFSNSKRSGDNCLKSNVQKKQINLSGNS